MKPARDTTRRPARSRRRDRLEAGDAAQHRGLAAAGGTEQAADRARRRGEAHAAHDRRCAVGVLEAFDVDRSRHGPIVTWRLSVDGRCRVHLRGRRLRRAAARAARRSRCRRAGRAPGRVARERSPRGSNAAGSGVAPIERLREQRLAERAPARRLSRQPAARSPRPAAAISRSDRPRAPRRTAVDAGGDDDHPPADSRLPEQMRQSRARELDQSERRQRDAKRPSALLRPAR